MKKEKKVDFRCTESEYQELEKRAKTYGMKTGQYAREYIFNDTSRKKEFFTSKMAYLIQLQDITTASLSVVEKLPYNPNYQKQIEELKKYIKKSIELEKKIWDI